MASTSMLSELSPNAEVISKQYALKVNSSAAIGLQNVIKSNLGPTGTLKLLVSGSGQLKLTKDGITLLKEMQIQHPTASLIARSASAQDDITGDGTTSTILLIGELLRIAEQYISNDSIHPRIIADGYDIARIECIKFLSNSNIQQSLIPLQSANGNNNKQDFINKNRDLLLCIARTSLQTKINANLVEKVNEYN
jgi:T-complex protein 1 subunit zeta